MTQLSELIQRVITVSQAFVELSPEHIERVLNRLRKMEQEIDQNFPDDPSLTEIRAFIETVTLPGMMAAA